jgi:hypothetical protein
VLLIGTTKRRFIIPADYKGDVFIIYSALDGKPTTTHNTDMTFHVPRNGILYTTAPTIGGLTRDEYYCARGDGTQRRIDNLWSTTVQRTPENLTNDKDIGIFFPRSGTFAESTGCAVKYEEFTSELKLTSCRATQKETQTTSKRHLAPFSQDDRPPS